MGKGLETAMKNSQYYIDKHKVLYNKCLAEASDNHATDVTAGADSLYESCATAEHIVGYYLYWYGNSALEIWKENLAYAADRSGSITDMDRKVMKILEKLFPEN